ncbi:MAG: S41 family peptidase [Defluviitaleaceae bacterium]|nr:S41 family peptidase [Defluviitaleaceae bacterium]
MLKTNMRVFFIQNKKKLLIGAGAIAALAIVAFILMPVVLPALNRNIEERRFDNLEREDFLADFDYMIEVLQINFPHEETTQYATGINIWELAAEVRQKLADPLTPIDDAFEFLNILQEELFDPLDGIGHLFALHTDAYRGRMAGFFQILYYSTEYSRRRHGFDNFPRRDVWESVFLSEPVVTLHRDIVIDYLEGYYRGTYIPVIETDILEEGRVAYLKINRLPSSFSDARYDTRMYHWLYYIKDFEYLIIDIRGTSGQSTATFDFFVAGNAASQPLNIELNTYFNLGTYNEKWYNAYVEDRKFDGWWAIEPATPYTGQGFDMVYNRHYTIHPVDLGRRDVTFGGQVFMLIDDRTANAAEAIAAISKHSGFATLVGDATRAVGFMQGYVYFYLPNSGIVTRYDYGLTTDADGTPFAGRGITPHYENHAGMDALETTLAIIGSAN